MDNKYENLGRNEVVSVKAEHRIVVSHTTFKVNEFAQAIKTQISVNNGQQTMRDMWFAEGVECEVLSPGKDWRKGKVRVSLEFIPDEPEVEEELENDEPTNNESESMLDDLRRRIQQSS